MSEIITIDQLPKGMGYFATAYTHPLPHVMARRARMATDLWLRLKARGLVLYPAITAGVGAMHILGKELPHSHEFWRGHNLGVLAECSYILLATTEGWSTSAGITDEVSAPEGKNLPRFWIDPETLTITTTAEPAAEKRAA